MLEENQFYLYRYIENQKYYLRVLKGKYFFYVREKYYAQKFKVEYFEYNKDFKLFR